MKRVLQLMLVMLITVVTGFAQDRRITGQVIGASDGLGIPGASILIKGTNTGTVTDADGNFGVAVPPGSQILVISFIGYKTVEVEVRTQSTLTISLEADAQQLSEVLVTGYREESKRSLTGTVNTVSSKEIQDVPMASIDQVLQGRSPGVLVLGSSGQPGAPATVTIRGRGSIAGSTTPLYVIDGVPVDPESFNTINANDYDVVSILTDASATSIYGSRAANGVIILNSKKGKAGKTNFNYRTQYGFSAAPDNKLELMNSNEKIDFELLTGGSLLEELSEEQITELRKINTDWQDVLFQRGSFQTHDFSASGGNERTTFFVSAGYLKQEGSVVNTLLERYTTRFNIAHEAGKFRFGVNTTLGYSDNKGTDENDAFIGSPLNGVRWANPYEKPYDNQGRFTQIRTGQPNPLQELVVNQRGNRDLKIVGSFNVAYDILDNLTIKSVVGTDFDQQDGFFFFDRSTYSGQQATGENGSYSRAYDYDVRLVNTNSILYSTEFAGDHTLALGLYQETNYRQRKGFSFTGYGLTGNARNESGITVSDLFLPDLGGFNSESGLVSYFTDIKYGYKDKYHLALGYRRDGSSRFGKSNQYASFYSIGANWIISDEEFFTGLTNVVNLLKLNASFGTSGNQEDLGDFQSYELYGSTFPYDGGQGIRQIQLSNPNLKWETQKMTDVSVEYALLNNRITGKLGFYNKLTEDLLFNSPVSQTTGYTSIVQNVGSLQNRGVEIAVAADVVSSGDFNWNVSANFTYNRNEIKKIYGNVQQIADPEDYLVLQVGKPIGTNYMVEYLGVNPANGDPLYRKADGTVTNQFSAADLRAWGTRYAPRFGGFTNTVSYKGLELTAFFTWVHGNQVYNADRTNVENPTYFVDQMAKSMLTAWKKPGDITEVPRVQTVDGLTSADFQTQTTRYLEDGSFLRLRNVMLAYNVPSKVLSRFKVSNVRVFAQGQNLFTRSEFLGWDPELASGTLTGAQYPALRTLTFGLNVGL